MEIGKLVNGLVIASITLVVAGAIALVVLSTRWDAEFISKCNASGGVPKIGRDVRLCLNPDALVKVD